MLLAGEPSAQLAVLCSRKANHSFWIPNFSVVSAVAFAVRSVLSLRDCEWLILSLSLRRRRKRYA